MVAACWICRGRARGKTLASASTSVWEKGTLPALVLNPDNSLPLHMPLVPFEYWSSDGVSPCAGPIRGTAWESRSLLSHSATSPAGSYIQTLWRLFFLKPFPLKPWVGVPDTGLGALASQGGSPQLRYPSQFLSTSCGCGTSQFCASTPPTSLNVVFSLYP